jgi:hypothetical protein
MEVCEELAFHGIEYILSVSVADGQVLHVDVEKVKAPCTSRNARCSALHDAGAPATPVRAFTSGRDVQKEHAHDAQKEDVHATMLRRRTRTPSFGAMRRRSALPAPDRTR